MHLRWCCSRCSDGAIALKNDPQGLCAVCRSKCHPDPAAQLAERDAIIDEAMRLLEEASPGSWHKAVAAAEWCNAYAALRARIEEIRK